MKKGETDVANYVTALSAHKDWKKTLLGHPVLRAIRTTTLKGIQI